MVLVTMPSQIETVDPLPRLEMVVLALIVEQPGHGYELWKRCEVRFGPTLYASNQKVYSACKRLLRHGLIEEIDDESGRNLRRPYRATAAGGRLHRERIVAELRDDPQITGFRERILSIGRDDPRALLALVARYEEAVLDDTDRLQRAAKDQSLRGRLLTELLRARLTADLDFAKRAREMINGEG